jgi:hypothetical protein
MRTHVSSVRNAHVARRSEHMQGHADAGAREARRGREADAGASHSMLWRTRRSQHMQGHADAGAREAQRGREADAGARATACCGARGAVSTCRGTQMQGHARRGEGARQMLGHAPQHAVAREAQ